MFEKVFDSHPCDAAVREGKVPATIPCDNFRTRYVKVQVEKARERMRAASNVGTNLSCLPDPFEIPPTRGQYAIFQAHLATVDLGSQLVKEEPCNGQAGK